MWKQHGIGRKKRKGSKRERVGEGFGKQQARGLDFIFPNPKTKSTIQWKLFIA